MSIANIVASGLKMRKTSGKLQFLINCKFPKVFCIFDPLAIIFAMDIYIFFKNTKKLGKNSDPIRASAIFLEAI